MDRDNLIVDNIFIDDTTANLEAVRYEAQRQAVVALILMVAGLALAIAGIAGMLLWLGRAAGLSLLLCMQRVGAVNKQRWRKIRIYRSGRNGHQTS